MGPISGILTRPRDKLRDLWDARGASEDLRVSMSVLTSSHFSREMGPMLLKLAQGFIGDNDKIRS